MKKELQNEARKLRSAGFSIGEIRQKLNISKSSASVWVRNIKLNKKQLKKLSDRGKDKIVIEQRRATRLDRENIKRQVIIDQAKSEVEKINDRELWLIGVMLYWAEGGKTQRSLVRFANGDPEMIKIIMEFLRRICKVPENKFRCYLHIHPHLDYIKAEKYWSKITRVNLKQFFKTYRKMNISSKNKKDNLPMGTLDVYVCDTELFLKIKGWSQGIFSSY
ncbi:MAG: hypothetical protein ACD_72C00457G0002 [uncultured bacterium]|nr:MAG: hypothetical protein ACD_72C00457G0002 [uncultured bacterium]